MRDSFLTRYLATSFVFQTTVRAGALLQKELEPYYDSSYSAVSSCCTVENVIVSIPVFWRCWATSFPILWPCLARFEALRYSGGIAGWVMIGWTSPCPRSAFDLLITRSGKGKGGKDGQIWEQAQVMYIKAQLWSLTLYLVDLELELT